MAPEAMINASQVKVFLPPPIRKEFWRGSLIDRSKTNFVPNFSAAYAFYPLVQALDTFRKSREIFHLGGNGQLSACWIPSITSGSRLAREL